MTFTSEIVTGGVPRRPSNCAAALGRAEYIAPTPTAARASKAVRRSMMSVSDLEGRRPGRSYSIETLRQVRTEVGPTWELYFILGLDAVLEIATWKDYQDLFTLSHFVVRIRNYQASPN